MTDAHLSPGSGRLDQAIDRTIDALVRRDAPSAIRERVFARLRERHSAETPRLRTWRQPRALLWTAATIVVVGVALVAPQWWARTDAPAPPARADLALTLPPARPVDDRTVRVPAVTRADASAGGTRVGPGYGAVQRLDSSAVPTDLATREPFIDPLPSPDPIVIAALEGELVEAERVNIEPLSVEALLIAPLYELR